MDETKKNKSPALQGDFAQLPTSPYSSHNPEQPPHNLILLLDVLPLLRQEGSGGGTSSSLALLSMRFHSSLIFARVPACAQTRV